MASEPRVLIVNADDFGLSEGINRGILSAHQAGVLRSTSLMPNGPAFDNAVHIAKATPSLDVGVHLNLIAEKSVAPAGELHGMIDAEGRLPESQRAFTRGLLGRKFSIGDVQTEIRAQIERVLSAGIDPTHIDSHRHVHMLPAVFSVVLNVAREYGIGSVRVPLDRDVQESGGLFSRLMHTLILPRIERTRLRQVEAVGLHTADWFWGLGMTGHMDEASLMAVLQSLRPGVNEVMCHPGITDEFTSEQYAWGYEWDKELAALKSDAVRRFIDGNDIRLASFADAWE